VTGESPWVPRATCDASCLAAGSAPSGRAVVVAMRVAVRATLAVILLSAVPLLAIPMPGRSHIQRGYCRLMLRALGVRITVSGGPIRNLRGVLVVSGHVSWVDIFSIGAVMPGSFVAKAEMISWPGLGVAARLMKVIPIERASLRRLPDVVGMVATRLRAGQTVVVVAYVGDDTLLASIRRLVTARRTIVHVQVESLQLPGTNRRDLAARCEAAVRGDTARGANGHALAA
jgi:hypothetical protein